MVSLSIGIGLLQEISNILFQHIDALLNTQHADFLIDIQHLLEEVQVVTLNFHRIARFNQHTIVHESSKSSCHCCSTFQYPPLSAPTRVIIPSCWSFLRWYLMPSSVISPIWIASSLRLTIGWAMRQLTIFCWTSEIIWVVFWVVPCSSIDKSGRLNSFSDVHSAEKLNSQSMKIREPQLSLQLPFQINTH